MAAWTRARIRIYFRQRVAAVGFVLLTMWKVPPWIVVILLALAGIALQFV